MFKYVTIYFAINSIICRAIDISSKLDFDNSKLSRRITTHKLPSQRNYEHENRKADEDFANVGVIKLCVENCNVTQSKDSLQTDVLVHVKTNIDINDSNKSIIFDDSSDVPIIVGSADQTRKDNNIIGPSTPVDSQYSRFHSNIHPGNIFKDKNIYPPTEHKIDVKLQPLSSVTFKMPQRGIDVDNKRRQNTVELHLPYLQTSHQRHYFGENPPPEIIWYPKATEYQFKPSYRKELETLSSTTQDHDLVSGNICTCKKNIPAGLQWYPTKQNYNIAPYTQISDKLSPLN